ncbi:MAG: hypothetical protein LBR44_05855 [Clostridiales Family XIII bacterium]|jgi:hypothetical protein|nr:hypothetical protein [Clostridiales Family XIII bacterium]
MARRSNKRNSANLSWIWEAVRQIVLLAKKKRRQFLVLAAVIIAIIVIICVIANSVGSEGKKPDGGSSAPPTGSSVLVELEPVSTAGASSLVGSWAGVNPDSAALNDGTVNNEFFFEFNEDGTCTFEGGRYKYFSDGSPYYGKKYFGTYTLSADGGELSMDLYGGKAGENAEGKSPDEYTDPGRSAGEGTLALKFRLYAGDVKAVLLVSEGDTDVIKSNVFLVLQPAPITQLYFGEPYLATEQMNVIPDTFLAEPEPAVIANTEAGLNVRSGPTTEHYAYVQLPNGTRVVKIAKLAAGAQDWTFCLFDGGGGWLNDAYLASE